MLLIIFTAAAGFIGGYVMMAFVSYGGYVRAARRRGVLKKRAGGKPPPDKRRETSKLLAWWAVIIATGMAVSSVALAAFDKLPLNDLTITVFTSCVGYLVTYAGKSAFEKNSRNKHGLDEYGNPFNNHFEDLGDDHGHKTGLYP